MRALTTLTIRTKLLTMTLLIVACAGGAGLWGLVNLRTASAAFQVMSGTELPATESLGEATADMQRALVTERSLMFLRQASDDAVAVRREHVEALDEVQHHWSSYTAIAGDGEDRERQQAFESAFAEWRKTSDEVVSLLQQDDPDARKDAIDVSLNEGKTKFDAARAAIASIAEARLARAHAYGEAVGAKAVWTERWTAVVLLLLTVASCAAALRLARLITRPLAAVVRVADGAAAGDLTGRVAVESRDELGHMGEALNRMLAAFRDSLVAVRQAAGRTAGVAAGLVAGAEELSSGTQEQAVSLEETAASLEEITATVQQNAAGATKADGLVTTARTGAEVGGAVVREAVEAMAAITEASHRIAAITSSMDEIAFQTNLLALNAAVEAARAGEQGRGFAVVATEIRALAQRAAVASKEIANLIRDAGTKVERGAGLVTRSGDTLMEIITGVEEVAALVADIAAASREQAAGIDQVSRAVTQMDQATQQASAQSENLSSTAQVLSADAAALEALVARFSLGDVASGELTSS